MNYDLVGISEVADMLGLTRLTKTKTCKFRKKFKDFPKPVVELKCGPIFYRSSILNWIRAHELPEKKGTYN